MNKKTVRGALTLLIAITMAIVACSLGDDEGPPRNSIVIDVVANTSLGPWLEAAVATFNESEIETADGKQAYVLLSLTESGQAVANISGGVDRPTLWLPEERVWVNVLADQGVLDYADDCTSMATSPLVIAMWRPMAESLGWPSLPLGWLDIGSLAADPSAWAYYSGGVYGDSLRLGHTHPGLSGSGASTLLAIVQSAQSKTSAVTVGDVQEPIVRASVGAFEAAVSTFSSSTSDLGQSMGQRDAQYLGAAVMYESNVVTQGNPEIIPIYPFEGTFVANHPACIDQSAASESGEAATLFRDFLLSQEGQELAMSNGLRPVDTEIVFGPPLDAERGVNLNQPQVVFNSPTVSTIYAVQDLWRSARKDVNLVMLLDVSGSMEGQKIANMRRAAVQFVEQMGEEDYITIIAFSHLLTRIADHHQVGPSRGQIIDAIEDLDAVGDTALYDSIGEGASIIARTTSPDTTNALVVLTDGQDTFSYQYEFGKELITLAAGNDTTVFAIAYGDDADQDVLSRLAYGANGNFYLGDEASIVAIYEEMSAAFGGTVGIGR